MKKLMSSYLIARTLIALFLVLTQPCLAGTWSDDFDDNNISEWTTLNIKRTQLNPGKPNGKWQISNGEAIGEIFNHANSEPWFSIFLTGESTWQHYSISCRAKLEHGVNAHGIPPVIGLSLYDTAEKNSGAEKNIELRYMFVIDYINEEAQIIQASGVNGVWVAQSVPFIAEMDTWYKLYAAIHKNGNMEFKIDNETIFLGERVQGFVISTQKGFTGLVVSNARARFDDIEITGENIQNGGPGRSFSVVPQGKLATTWSKLKSGKI